MALMNPNRWAAALFYCQILLLLTAVGSVSAGPSTSASKVIKLFGTIEFRSSLRVLPQWKRVLTVADDQAHRMSACSGAACSPAARSWQTVLKQAREQSPLAQLKTINSYFNKWPYILDIERFGVSDYWASPEEFLTLSGDCEDYSIVKYFALKQLRFDGRDMRIVVVKDRIRNVGHAVLAVYLDDTAYILDNLSNLVLPHDKYNHYLPQYSVNESNRWAHVKPVGNPNRGN